jgi:hypothetical protein
MAARLNHLRFILLTNAPKYDVPTLSLLNLPPFEGLISSGLTIKNIDLVQKSHDFSAVQDKR